MASALVILPPFSPSIRRPLSPSFSSRGRSKAFVLKAVQQGPSATYARDMERLSAKESLLLAFKDAGGFEALVTGKTTDVQRIDVTERITGLERLNPSPRPTTAPYLEGKWKLEWFSSDTPGFASARFILEKLPTTLANISKMDVLIKDGYTKVTANLRLLNSIETNLIFSSKLSVEGPLRLKEESIEGILQSPAVIEEAIPEQLKSLLNQVSNAAQQIPESIRDALSSGITFPLSGTFQRLLMISYLDDEILILRDTAGKAEVLTRLDAGPSPAVQQIPEPQS